jgi:hypothetical protein
MKYFFILFVSSFSILAYSNEQQTVYIIEPLDNAVLQSPVTIKFGLSGMGVAPAGVDRKNTGHHHLLLDLESLPDMTKSIPSDSNHIHFGGGQTETSMALIPGEHTLQLIMGNKFHVPHEVPLISSKISITVIE